MVALTEILGQLALGFSIVLNRALEILRQPALNKEMLWILLPMLVSLFLIELYFGRYTKEELGWNSAVSNALVLFFVGLNLASWLYAHEMLIGFTPVKVYLLETALIKTFIASLIIAESVLLLIFNFFHIVTKKFAFGISSSLIINFIGAISIILVYSDVPLDILTFPAVLVIFIGLVVFFWLIRLIEPKSYEENTEE